MRPDLALRLASALQVLHWRNLPVMLPLCTGAIVMLLPFLWMFSASLRPAGEAYHLPPSLLPDTWDATSYAQVFASGLPFLRMFWNSFVVAAVTTAGVLLTASMTAFAFARLRFRGAAALFALMFLG
jgi:multiple sugar transport system permease protein